MRARVVIGEQLLHLFGDDGACIRRYPISTAARGAGEEQGSHCTPRGRRPGARPDRCRCRLRYGVSWSQADW